MEAKENFFKCDALRSLLRPFLDPSSALSVALSRLDSDSIWHFHMRRIYGLVAYWFEHHVCFCTNTKLVPDSRAAVQATNAAARAKLCYSRSCIKRQTLQLGPNYATLVWHRRHLACRHVSSLHEHVAAQKFLGSLKNWSGHGLSNQTGSAGHEKEYTTTLTRAGSHTHLVGKIIS